MARACAAGLILALGGVTAVAVVGNAGADPPIGTPATVYLTETVHARYQGHSAGYWHLRSVQSRARLRASTKARALLRSQLMTVRANVRRRWAPTVAYGLALATAAWGVDQTHRAYCESKLDAFAAEGHGPLGLLQFQPSTWARTPFGGFSIYDPVAQALAGGWMVAHGRSGEWSCGL